MEIQKVSHIKNLFKTHTHTYIMNTIYTWFNNYTPKPSTQEKWSTRPHRSLLQTKFDIIYEGIIIDKGSKVETTQTPAPTEQQMQTPQCIHSIK